MARIDVNGLEIDYELIGKKGDPVAVITPGGRYPRETPGVPELGAKLVEAGWRVLLWDRPNCGGSQISFDGPSESAIQARALADLIPALGLGKVCLLGGSAGSRISIMAAALAPEQISKMAIWWISGGHISMAQLASYYCGDPAMRCAMGGMKLVAESPMWAEQIAKNPKNKDILLAQDPDAFIAKMQEWAGAFGWVDDTPIKGMGQADFDKLSMPVMVFRSGKSDMSHTRRASEWVAEVLPNSELVEPPWGDQEWNECLKIPAEPSRGRFERWPLLAPMLIDFLKG